MARDVLDVSHLTLCLELERASATVRGTPAAWPWLASLGVEPQALIARLGRLHREGHEAFTEQQFAKAQLAEARAAGMDAATAFHATLKEARVVLRALAILHPEVEPDVVSLRPLLAMPAPRVVGGLDHARRMLDELQREDQTVVRHPAGQALLVTTTDHERALSPAWSRILAAVRAHRAACGHAKAARTEMIRGLRQLRLWWKAAREMSEGSFAALDFPLAKAELANARSARPPADDLMQERDDEAGQDDGDAGVQQ